VQTGPQGKKVNKVLIAQDVYYPGESKPKEFYMSILLNRSTGRNIIMYSTEGGMDIEAVAEKTPHLIFKEEIDPKFGIQPFQARKIAFNLGLSGNAFKEMNRFVMSLSKAYDAIDASLIEINPLLKTSDDKIIAVDAKLNLDDNALFRHKDYEAMRDKSEEDPTEVEAGEYNLNYVKLDGNVGCMVNGAGLAMATMDIIKLAGGEPANFLDVGGTANAARVEQAFRIILKDPNVKAILVNIFGGIVRCDRVAQGIVDAYKNIGSIPVPIIVRLQGTNATEAKKIIDDSGLKVFSAIQLKEAADLVNKLLNS
jgi:succinyl-CoA synthetase beta subunit